MFWEYILLFSMYVKNVKKFHLPLETPGIMMSIPYLYTHTTMHNYHPPIVPIQSFPKQPKQPALARTFVHWTNRT